jgi:hypothetical protein
MPRPCRNATRIFASSLNPSPTDAECRFRDAEEEAALPLDAVYTVSARELIFAWSPSSVIRIAHTTSGSQSSESESSMRVYYDSAELLARAGEPS